MESLPADGDCFYNGVCRALGSLGAAPSVAELRAVVAQELDAATFETLRGLACAGVDGFQWCAPGRRIDPIESLQDIRARVAQTSAVAGKSRVVWADHFASKLL